MKKANLKRIFAAVFACAIVGTMSMYAVSAEKEDNDNVLVEEDDDISDGGDIDLGNTDTIEDPANDPVTLPMTDPVLVETVPDNTTAQTVQAVTSTPTTGNELNLLPAGAITGVLAIAAVAVKSLAKKGI